MLLNQMIPVYFHLFTFFLSFIWITNIYSQKAKWSREIGVLVGTHVYLHNINLICRFEEDVGSWNRSSNNTATYPEIDDVIDDHDHDRAHQIRWFLYGWTWMNTRTSQVFAKGWKFSRTSFGSIWTLPVRDLISKKKKRARGSFFFFSHEQILSTYSGKTADPFTLGDLPGTYTAVATEVIGQFFFLKYAK